ncbi:MAG: hypothetical protein LYZ66_02380 [Nitrososphaerales archaeon]|nr:hypothetical protein [Nitrososphaerales archaeon]
MKVNLGTLKSKGNELVEFLEPRVGTKPTLDGGTVEIDDDGLRKGVKPRHVKTYIKRFLYMNKLRKNYRVFVAGRELTVQELELGKEEEEEREKVKEKLEKAEKEEEKAREGEEPKRKEEKPEEPEKEEPKKAKKEGKEQTEKKAKPQAKKTKAKGKAGSKD